MFDLIDAAQTLIALRSVSVEGTKPVVDFLSPFCRELGFHLTLQPSPEGNRDMNLIAHTAAEGSTDLCPNGLALVTHLDTVPAGDKSLWTETGGDPWKATIKDGKIYGLGSADTKLDILCKLKAVEAVGLGKIKIPLALIGTFGEETALAGVRWLKQTHILHPKFVLVGEPSHLEPVVAHKGILYLRAVWETPHPSADSGHLPPQGGKAIKKETFAGKAAHGSMPHLGENAIAKAAEWIFAQKKIALCGINGGTVHNIVPEKCVVDYRTGEDFGGIGFLRHFFEKIAMANALLQEESNPAFDPPYSTCNVGVIRGDDHRIEIEFDFRMIPETDPESLLRIFQALGAVDGARIEMIRSNNPMNTDKKSEIADHVGKALKKVGLPVVYKAKSGNTEGAIFNEMGAQAIVIGPGRAVGNIHAPNEHNEIAQLHKAVEFYTAFLRQFC
jgi:succinyl-diaminopimelate desuccinylase